MSFLAPLLLLGALAVVLPVIFHLMRRTTRERTVFSSLMFLRATPPRLTRRSRLEHWLLLALRAAVIGLLAAGFARPFLRQPMPDSAGEGGAKRRVILVDTSASMRRGGLWERAQERVGFWLREVGPADEVGLAVFDRQLRPLLNFAEWRSAPAGDRVALLRARLAEVTPGWGATQMDEALIGAAEWLVEAEADVRWAERQVVVISDFAEGTKLGRLQGHAWPPGIEVRADRLEAGSGGNAGLEWLADTDPDTDTAEAGVAGKGGGVGASVGTGTGVGLGTVRVRVSNSAEARVDQFEVGWGRGAGGGWVGERVELQVPPGQSRVVALPAAGADAAVDRVVLRGDAELFDNTVFVVAPEPVRMELLYLGREGADDPAGALYYLQRAFPATSRQVVQVRAWGPERGAEAGAGDRGRAVLAVVTEGLREAALEQARRWLEAGRQLLFVPRDAEAASTLAALAGREPLGVGERRVERGALLGSIDFRHPLFAPFADPRFSDFTKIRFWRYRQFALEGWEAANVVARFDTGDPAIFEFGVGPGRVMVWASGWHPGDSPLARSTKFVPLLHAVLERSGGGATSARQYRVGDRVKLVSGAEGGARGTPVVGVRHVIRPDGQRVTLATGETEFEGTEWPGVYEWGVGAAGGVGATGKEEAERPGGTSGGSARVGGQWVVNVEGAESRTMALPLDELERLGVPVERDAVEAGVVVARKVQMENAELEGRQKLWRWFIVGTLGVLLVETWLAGRGARQVGLERVEAV